MTTLLTSMVATGQSSGEIEKHEKNEKYKTSPESLRTLYCTHLTRVSLYTLCSTYLTRFPLHTHTLYSTHLTRVPLHTHTHTHTHITHTHCADMLLLVASSVAAQFSDTGSPPHNTTPPTTCENLGLSTTVTLVLNRRITRGTRT